MNKALAGLSLRYPKTVIALTVLVTAFFAAQFSKAQIDTDPENRLEVNQPDRVFYRKVKQEFGIHDLLVVGWADEGGILRTETLGIQRFVEWGCDFLKYDWCSYGNIARNPDRAALQKPYRLIAGPSPPQPPSGPRSLAAKGPRRV